mgnify:CR=1 FL=1|tara:strand:- start:293 stop:457 length:165 start_codon:yes stop_codon:yes gene_type:complete
MAAFLSMGGYAAYVWSSYAITFGIMILLYVHTKRQGEKHLRWLRRHIVTRDNEK